MSLNIPLPRRCTFRWMVSACSCLGLVLFASVACADDPVEDLRNALIPLETGAEESARKQRDARITDSVKKLNTVRLLRRAFLLTEWSRSLEANQVIKDSYVTVKEEFRKEILRLKNEAMQGVKTFQAEARAAKQSPNFVKLKSDYDQLIAVGMLIGELSEHEPIDARKQEFVRDLKDVVLELALLEPLVPANGTDLEAISKLGFTVRYVAVRSLGKITPPPEKKVIDVVTDSLKKSNDLRLRRVAAYALVDLARNAKYLSPREQVQTISTAVRSATIGMKDASTQAHPGADEQVRGYCLLALIEATKSLNEMPLLNKVQVEDEFKGALVAMEAMNESISDSLVDSDPRVRLTAMDALTQLGVTRKRLLDRLALAEEPKLDPKAPEKRNGKNPLEAAGGTDPLKTILTRKLAVVGGVLKSDPDVRMRRGAIDFLESLGEHGTHCMPEINDAINHDTDPLVRAGAAHAVRFCAPREKLPIDTVLALTKLLFDSDGDVHASAVATLEVLGPSVRQAINRQETDPGTIQMQAAVITNLTNAIAKQQVNRAVANIIFQADTNLIDPENRVAVMKALVAIGGKAAIESYPNVVQLLKDPDARVRRAAAETLGAIGQILPPRGAERTAFESVVLPALTDALHDTDSEVRVNASDAILIVSTRPKL